MFSSRPSNQPTLYCGTCYWKAWEASDWHLSFFSTIVIPAVPPGGPSLLNRDPALSHQLLQRQPKSWPERCLPVGLTGRWSLVLSLLPLLDRFRTLEILLANSVNLGKTGVEFEATSRKEGISLLLRGCTICRQLVEKSHTIAKLQGCWVPCCTASQLLGNSVSTAETITQDSCYRSSSGRPSPGSSHHYPSSRRLEEVAWKLLGTEYGQTSGN